MPILYYWRPDNYHRDLDFGAGYHLNQANPKLHDISIGDSVWAFTRRKNGSYALAAHLIVKALTINSPQFHYGKYRVWGDLTKSKYFIIDSQSNIEELIRRLSCKTDAKILGRAFQGLSAVRHISDKDHEILLKYSLNLLIEPRAKILPEDKLEASLIYGNEGIIKDFLKEEESGVTKARLEYLYKIVSVRNKKLVGELQNIYDGKCQICEWSPINQYEQYICQGHHIQWLSRGGEDNISNLILVCPNHHCAIHKCDAPFDYANYSFKFSFHEEVLKINKHIAPSDKRA